jgi:hypothetical protein
MPCDGEKADGCYRVVRRGISQAWLRPPALWMMLKMTNLEASSFRNHLVLHCRFSPSAPVKLWVAQLAKRLRNRPDVLPFVPSIQPLSGFTAFADKL